jgi:hypothetical protein
LTIDDRTGDDAVGILDLLDIAHAHTLVLGALLGG